MAQHVTIHGHFYQPPREDPWTGLIDEQPGAAPFHDWNERVHAECYRPNAFVTIPGPDGDVVVNNFEKLSFNVGPTLMSWMETADPETYDRIIQGDRTSLARSGKGNAIAQSYHHTILPLSNVRDCRTQVRWGLADFRHRFGRDAQGLWLPETAANDEVLAILIDEGVTFTILAPGQAGAWREGDGGWIDVEEAPIDPRVGYRYEHPDGSGRALSLLFYEGDIARAIAFENAGSSAEGFLSLFAERSLDGCSLVHAATDGETYGHHHRFSDLGLAYALFVEAERAGLNVVNYAAFLDMCPPRHEARLKKGEGTSWSCAHGVGRWKEHCGCSTGGEPGWEQQWRAPLREALEIVRDAADEIFERLGRELIHDPWSARDEYIHVLLGATGIEDLVKEHSFGPVTSETLARATDLLELQRNSMAMFTSCGWFFNDIGGIETIQVLRYAARTLDLLEELGGPVPADRFTTILSGASSNDPELGTGADIFAAIAKP
ncbi:MAG TPA: DUF3536 domain-containing protein [Actinomycetota bacterium]|nr:DUF3536 domain-containing protein [Actinomycetota bacterium]